MIFKADFLLGSTLIRKALFLRIKSQWLIAGSSPHLTLFCSRIRFYMLNLSYREQRGNEKEGSGEVCR